MISNFTHTSGSNYVQLMWTRPKYHPKLYELKYVCIMKKNTGHHSSSTNIIKTMTQYLISGSCSIIIADLRPSSKCVLNLIAVYNPASIDAGIVIIVSTSKLPLNCCKWFDELFKSVAFVLSKEISIFVCFFME